MSARQVTFRTVWCWLSLIGAGALPCCGNDEEGNGAPSEMAASEVEMPDIAGTWLGTLELLSVRLVVNIERDAEGNLGGTLDSPDQGGFDIPLSRVEVSANVVTLAADSLALVFTGELSEDARQ